MSHRHVLLLALATLSLAGGCRTYTPLGEQCSLNTDCEPPLVCRLSRCRNWCSGDRDCPVGLYCAVDNQGLGSCLLPDESECDVSGPEVCPDGTACAPNGICMSTCESSVECLWSGACIEGFCVDVTLSEDDGGPGTDAGVIVDLRDGETCLDEERCNGMDDDCDGAIDERADEFCNTRPNATGECRDGACRLACAAGFDDCNGVQMDGCETDVTTDPAHCGMCERGCPSGAGSSPVCMLGMCGLPVCDTGRGDCDRDDTNGCETSLEVDDGNCGACGRVCGPIFGGRTTCVASDCASACDMGFGDCNVDTSDGCETDTLRSETHCGACGTACMTGAACVDGVCTPAPFPSGGTTALAPTSDMVLTPGVHEYTSIMIPAGVTVTTSGSGVLDLRASGDVVIEGTIDVSGSTGGIGNMNNCSPAGGATGTPLAPGESLVAVCSTPAGGGSGAPGSQAPSTPMGCSEGGVFGGGSGGHGDGSDHGGGGGGGYAGGGGGGGPLRSGGDGASSGGDVGGTGGGACNGGQGGRGGDPFFDGEDGQGPACGFVGYGGGGGSIGASAASEPEVTLATFRPGSGGGGGSGLGGIGPASTCGAGGGGGGGALRIASATRIRIAPGGAVRAAGGAGGSVSSALVTGGGGGGSGGVVYLVAPELDMVGTVSVAGGQGGESANRDGGDGGAGRIRLSVDPGACNATGTWLGATASCVEQLLPSPGQAYVATYPM